MGLENAVNGGCFLSIVLFVSYVRLDRDAVKRREQDYLDVIFRQSCSEDI